MRTEYHQKLDDIERNFESKDRALNKERMILQRDLDEAREDVRLYGDEIDETIEYGMVLPESISARKVDLPEPVKPQIDEQNEQRWNPHQSPHHMYGVKEELPFVPLHHLITPEEVHTFNQLPSIYQNLVNR